MMARGFDDAHRDNPSDPVREARSRKGNAWRDGVSAAALMATQFDPVRYIIDRYLVEGVTLLAGNPKAGKSYLALHWCVCVAAGWPVFKTIPVQQGDVLYLALEDNRRRLKKRLLTFCPHGAPERLQLVTEWPDLDHGCLDELAAWVESVPEPRLIVIDVLARIRCQERDTEPVYGADYRTLMGLQAFAAQHRVAIVVVTHTRKAPSDSDPFDCVTGSRGLVGAADSCLILKRDFGTGETGKTGRCLIYGRGRDLDEIETAIRFDWSQGLIQELGNAREVARTCERQAVLDALEAAEEPLSVQDIADETGGKISNTRRLLTRMAKKGQIRRIERGRYASPNGPNVPNTPQRDNGTKKTDLINKHARARGRWSENPALGRLDPGQPDPADDDPDPLDQSPMSGGKL